MLQIIYLPALFQKEFVFRLKFHANDVCPLYFAVLFGLTSVLNDVHFQRLLLIPLHSIHDNKQQHQLKL